MGGENLLEERPHGRPRTPVCFRLVLDVGDAEFIGIGIGKGMVSAAVDDHLPIHTRLAHLLLEGGDLLGRDEGVVAAGADQDFALDIFGVARAVGFESAGLMKPLTSLMASI